MVTDFMIKIFEEHKNRDAVVWNDRVHSYGYLLSRIRYWQEKIKSEGIKQGTVTVLEADFSPNSIALFLALIEHSCILVPLTISVEAKKPEFIKIAQGEISFAVDGNDDVKITKLPACANHELYDELRRLNHPGLVFFSSGSTGKSKAAVHDVVNLLKKYKTKRHDLRTLIFCLFDHIAGIDTLFYALSNGSCIITVGDRSPDAICSAIEKYRVEVLPLSPTFLNLLIISQAYSRHNLSSLKYVAYGTEVMPEVTLKKVCRNFSASNYAAKVWYD